MKNLTFIFILISLNLLAQKPVEIPLTKKYAAESLVKQYCEAIIGVTKDKAESVALLSEMIIEQMGNDSWDDIKTGKDISFNRYISILSEEHPDMEFVNIPGYKNFLYFFGERIVQDKRIFIPYIVAPITKKINGKEFKGYLTIRARTLKVVDYKKNLPEWATVYSEKDITHEVNKQTAINVPITDFKKLLEFKDKNGKYGFMDYNGKIVVQAIYDNVDFFSEGLISVGKNRKYGYIDKTGKVVIPFIYDDATFFSEGLAAVEKNGKYGFIDKTGKVVIPFIYDYATFFSEGLASVEKNGLYGFINKIGDVVIPFLFNEVSSFSEGLVSVEKNGLYGFVDKNGRKITPFIYDYAFDFSEGLALVKKNGKYGFVNKNGEIIKPCIYEYAWRLSEGLAQVKVNGKYGYINKRGNTVIPNIYDNASRFSEGLAVVFKNGKYSFINKTGSLVVPDINYYNIGLFSEGLVDVMKTSIVNGSYTELYGFINRYGKTVIPAIYEYVSSFKDGIARVKKNGQFLYIDKKGNEIKPHN